MLPARRILPFFFFGNVSYYIHLLKGNYIIDVGENYVKQSFRNRFSIAGPNKIQHLSIEIEGQKGVKKPLKDIEVRHGKWQREHVHSLRTAYNSSPFFFHFEDDINLLFEKKFRFLLDYNLHAFELVKDWIDIEVDLCLTKEFVHPSSEKIDLRNKSNWKLNQEFPEYPFPFQEKYSFAPDLSIFDLICNIGPESLSYLEKNSHLVD